VLKATNQKPTLIKLISLPIKDSQDQQIVLVVSDWFCVISHTNTANRLPKAAKYATIPRFYIALLY
jgi:hypothetical protein